MNKYKCVCPICGDFIGECDSLPTDIEAFERLQTDRDAHMRREHTGDMDPSTWASEMQSLQPTDVSYWR